MGLNDRHGLSHSKRTCSYHIVFAPNCRRQVFCGEKKRAAGQRLRQLCEWKGVNIIEAELCPDHVHRLLERPPKMKTPAFTGYLKGKSATMICEQFGGLKYKYGNREFRCRGYDIDTAGKNGARIAESIRHQPEEDKPGDRLSMPEADSSGNRKRKQHHTQPADRLRV